jgi:hypothetical protein
LGALGALLNGLTVFENLLAGTSGAIDVMAIEFE